MGARKSEEVRGLCPQKRSAVESWNASSETDSSGTKGHVERVHIDLLGPFPESDAGNKYIALTICPLTKFVECRRNLA